MGGLGESIMEEAYGSRYSIHWGSKKMYIVLQEIYSWNGTKRDIADFVAKCPNFQQVKVKHQSMGGLIRNIDITSRKWDDIKMDFIVGLPLTQKQHESIRVIVNRLTSKHFLPIKVTDLAKDYAKLYFK